MLRPVIIILHAFFSINSLSGDAERGGRWGRGTGESGGNRKSNPAGLKSLRNGALVSS